MRFLLGLAASRGSQNRGLTDEEREVLLDEAIAAFRSILIARPDWCACAWNWPWPSISRRRTSLAREHFERALVGKPPEALVENVTRLLKVIRARRRWDAWYFGFSVAPDTNINAASDAQFIYINGLPFRRGAVGIQASTGIGLVGWGGGEYQYPLGPPVAAAHGILNLNHREYKGGRWDQTFLAGHVGPRWLISPGLPK